MATETLTFPGATGAPLSGVLHHPEGAPAGSVLLAHCFTCSKDYHTMTRLARGLAEAGYAVLRFDLPGLGESGGEFVETTVSTNVTDLHAAAHALLERGDGPCALLGHSLGGAAVLLAAGDLPAVRSVVVLNAPSEPRHLRRVFDGVADRIVREGEAVVEIAGRPFPIARSFLEDLERHEAGEHLTALERPLLVLHAVDDTVVDVTEGERIFALAAQPKAFVPLLDADHLLTSRAASAQALAVIRPWLDHTLGGRA